MSERPPRSLSSRLLPWVGGLALACLLLFLWEGSRAEAELSRLGEALSADVQTFRTHLNWQLAAGIGLSLAGTLLFTLWASARLGRNLNRLRQGADRMAAGELETVLPADLRPRELGQLGDSIQRLSQSLARQLREEEERRRELDALLAGLHDGVLALDPQGRVQACNPAAQQLLGLAEVQPGTLLAKLGAPPELVQALSGPWLEAEVELTFAQGPLRELRVHTLPLVRPGLSDERLLVVLTDISTINQVERLRRDFAANVSHELKTPVTSIRGYAELLREEGADAAGAAGFVDVIERQARRLDAIIDDLLDLSRLERQRDEDPPALLPVPLAPLLRELIEDHRFQAGQARMSLRLELAPGLPVELLSQRNLLQRALANLLSNALRYGRAESTVTIWAGRDRRQPDQVLVEVRDQGCGIAAEHLPRLFERFYVVDKARSRALGGTGLGLAIVKHLIALLQGEVGVFSVAGEGSTFWLRLPAVQDLP